MEEIVMDYTTPKLEPETIKRMRQPFAPESVKFKIQTASAGGALIVSYIDARHVAERLNTLVPGQWSDAYSVITHGEKIMGAECRLTIGHVTRTDVGTTNDDKDIPDHRMGGLKILYSDAFKRAAVKFGIGAFLYSLPATWLRPQFLEGDAPKWKIPEQTHDNLRKKYAKWLDTTGNELFGETVSYGDEESSQGDIDVQEEV